MMRGESHLPTRYLGGFPIADTRSQELIDLLLERTDRGQRTELFFANSNFILQCYPFADALTTVDSLIVNDGIALDFASLLLFRKSFPENLNGTDFTPLLLTQVKHTTRVFLLGARPSVVSKAAARLAKVDRIEIVGAVDGYEGVEDDARVLSTLNESKPDILLVALGNPFQERWIVAHRNQHDVKLVVAVGALLDFLSGTMPRAPMLVQRMKLEWLYRLLHEPRRLLRRYTIDMAKFFLHCWRTRWETSTSTNRPPSL